MKIVSSLGGTDCLFGNKSPEEMYILLGFRRKKNIENFFLLQLKKVNDFSSICQRIATLHRKRKSVSTFDLMVQRFFGTSSLGNISMIVFWLIPKSRERYMWLH